MPTQDRIREWAENPWLLLLSRIIAPMATAGMLALFAVLWSMNGRMIALEHQTISNRQLLSELSQVTLSNSERISAREAVAFTAADGASLQAELNARIDRNYERLTAQNTELREDIRLLTRRDVN